MTNQYFYLNPKDIKPDPLNPRVDFSVQDESFKRLVQGMITEGGNINAIEIDDDNRIVTGERRWRAAIEAGMDKIKCVRTNIEGRPRKRRQVIENISSNTMTAFDTGVALAQLLDIIPVDWTHRDKDIETVAKEMANFISKNVGPGLTFSQEVGGAGNEGGISALSNEIGMDRSAIRDHLKYLREAPKVLEYLRKEGAKPTLIREVNRHVKNNPDLANRIKEKVVNGSIQDRDTVNEIINVVKERPEATEAVLGQNYNEGRTTLNTHKVLETAGVTTQKANDYTWGILTVLEKVDEALLRLTKMTPEVVIANDRPQILRRLDELEETIRKVRSMLDMEEAELVEE